MRTYLLKRQQLLPRARREVFAFFGDAFNLERITPPFLRFRVLTQSPIEMKAGALLDYQLALFGVPFRWQTLIEQWSPDEVFVDTQLTGPYALWQHMHIFEEVRPALTLMRDRVLYRIPYGVLGRVAQVALVRRTLNEIFDYRAAKCAELLAALTPINAARRREIA